MTVNDALIYGEDYFTSQDLNSVFTSFLLSGHVELIDVINNGIKKNERFSTHSNSYILPSLFENIPNNIVEKRMYHVILTNEYIRNFYPDDYSTKAGVEQLSKVLKILHKILDINLEHFDIKNSILVNLGFTRGHDAEMTLLKQKIRLSLTRSLLTFTYQRISSSFRLDLREYLESYGTLSKELDFFIRNIFSTKVQDLVKPLCKIKLDTVLFDKYFARYGAAMTPYISYIVNVRPLSSDHYTEIGSYLLAHDKVLTSQSTDVIKIASFLKYMAKTYGPIRLYGCRMATTGLNMDYHSPASYYPSRLNIKVRDPAWSNQAGKRHPYAFFLEYDETTGGFKNFDETDFKIFLGSLLLDSQTMVVRTEQMTNNALSSNKILFAFNFWQNRLNPSDLIGGSTGPVLGLTSGDGLFGIPVGSYKNLADKWENFMKEKNLNPLYRFNRDSDWFLYCELVSYLNQDLANLGDPADF